MGFRFSAKPIGGHGLGFKDRTAGFGNAKRRHTDGGEETVEEMVKSAKKEASMVLSVGSSSSSRAGPNMAADRYAAVKAVMQSKFKTQFVSASSTSPGEKVPENPVGNEDPKGQADRDRKRKTRWE